jgi:hypothetical protein
MSTVILALALPASAAQVDPSRLVLRQSDVPTGFRVDGSETGLLSNAKAAEGEPRFRPLFPRWGRLTGYEVVFNRGESTIGSRVDVLRTPAGAAAMLAWIRRELRKGGRGFPRVQVSVGDEAVMHRSRVPRAIAVVAWRAGRLVGLVGTVGLPSQRTVAFARRQQRRIDAALR